MNVASAEADVRLRRAFAAAALAGIALTLVVISASAFIRHSQAGLSCHDWPACYARVNGGATYSPPLRGVELARVAHRLAVTGIIVAVLSLLLLVWTRGADWRRERRFAIAALLIVGALGVLGVATPGARLPVIVLSNLLGGFLLLAVLTATFSTVASPASAIDERMRLLASAALVLVFVQVASGGMIGAQFAALACPSLADCGVWSWQDFLDGGSWNPLRLPVEANRHVITPVGAAGLHILHRASSTGVVVLCLVVAAMLRKVRPQLAVAIAGLAAVEACAGIAAVMSGPGLAIVVAHNAGAALVVVTLAAAAVPGRCTAS